MFFELFAVFEELLLRYCSEVSPSSWEGLGREWLWGFGVLEVGLEGVECWSVVGWRFADFVRGCGDWVSAGGWEWVWDAGFGVRWGMREVDLGLGLVRVLWGGVECFLREGSPVMVELLMDFFEGLRFSVGAMKLPFWEL